MTLTENAGRAQMMTALLAALGMALAVGTALGFQYIGGYIPCMLCLEQRVPYYIGLPVVLLAAVAAGLHLPGWVARLLLLAGALLMVWTCALGIYHAGVEWGFWLGPADCGAVASPAGSGSGGVLDQLNTVVPPSCDKAAGRFLGISFAGWNVVASAVIAVIAVTGAFATRDRVDGRA